MTGVVVSPAGEAAVVESPPDSTAGYVSNYVPREMDQHLDFLAFRDNGELLLGSSSLNRRCWTGAVWWFNSADAAPSVPAARTGVQLEAGVVRGRTVGRGQLLVALDSGAIQLINLLSVPHDLKAGVTVHSLEPLLAVIEHEDSITDMDTWCSSGSSQENLAVTVGRDRRICVWSHSIALLHSYHPAHNTDICSVSCNQLNTAIFSTAGLDGTVKVWDIRKEKPALTLFSSQDLPPGLVTHDRTREHQLVVAASTGDLFTLDTRSPKTERPQTRPIFDREVRSAAWCPDQPDLLALAGDDTVVSVLRVGEGELEEVYRSSEAHTDFVRGLAWNPVDGKLWSSGWDKKVLSHTLSL